jgi:hypothetical protein
MFEKLAKVRSFGLWLATPQRETVRSQVVACNDNRPGVVRRNGPVAHSLQSRAGRLACRWSVSPDGRLVCRWELHDDTQSSAPAADPPPRRAGRNPMDVIGIAAGQRPAAGRMRTRLRMQGQERAVTVQV